MTKTCASCKSWNVLDLRCKQVGWPVAASHSCEKWTDAKEEGCDCSSKCENACAGCSDETKDALDALSDILGDWDDD